MGEVYHSRAAAYQVPVRDRTPLYAPGSGVIIGELRELTAEFAIHGREFQILDEEGEPIPDPLSNKPEWYADIRGHCCDLDAQAEAKGWTDEEKELVRQRLDHLCLTEPHWIWKKSPVKAMLPWPNYDTFGWEKVISLAEQLDLVAETLAYEIENKNRKMVVDALQKLLVAKKAESELTVA